MITDLLNALIPIWIDAAVILNIVLASIGGAMVVVWVLEQLWRLLHGKRS